MQSMTGYAFVENSTEQFSYTVELKTLNSRYLEIYTNVPRVMRNEENEINSILKESFSRGKLEINIDIFDWVDTRPVSLNTDLIRKYYKELEKVHDSLIIKEPLKFESVLTLEGLINRDRTVLSDKSMKDIYKTIEAVIRKTIEMRKKEGSSIKKDLTTCLGEISDSVTKVKDLAKDVSSDKMDQLRKRLESLTGSKMDDVRMYTEIAILSDKLDINEEIVRLNDHQKKFKAILKEKDSVGKKLDFIAQEMFREINTIASKANSSEVSHIVVDVKNNIEKIREQCRNIV